MIGRESELRRLRSYFAQLDALELGAFVRFDPTLTSQFNALPITILEFVTDSETIFRDLAATRATTVNQLGTMEAILRKRGIDDRDRERRGQHAPRHPRAGGSRPASPEAARPVAARPGHKPR